MDRDKISDALETLAQALDSSTRNKQPTMRTKRTDSRALLRKDKSRRNSLDVGETEDGDPTSLFFESDKDKSGGIELNEFVDVVKVLNPSQKEDDVKRKFESADLRKTGSLSLPEFVRVIDPVACWGIAVGGCKPAAWNKDKKHSWRSKVSKCAEWLPFVNFFYYVFCQTSTRTGVCMVTSDSIIEIANNVALIAALLYTVVTALPGAITWDELDIVDYHYKSVSKEVWEGALEATYTSSEDDKSMSGVFGSSGKGASAYTGNGTDFPEIYIGRYGCQYSKQYPPWQPMSVRLGNEMAQTGTWLAVSFFLAILLIISISSLTRLKRDTTSAEMEIPEDSLEAWYWWARYHIIGMLGFLILGVGKTLLALSDVYYLKFPQPWLEQLCLDNGWEPVVTQDGNETSFEFWEPRDEMPNAVKYAGGRFVQYQSSVWRGWTKEITIGNNSTEYPTKVTEIENIDPGRENGQSPWIIVICIFAGTFILGYAQACADSNAKHFYHLMELDRRDEAKAAEAEKSAMEKDLPPHRASTHNNAYIIGNTEYNEC